MTGTPDGPSDRPRVGLRELGQNPAAVIRRVRRGERLIVTDRGRPVAQITPLPRPLPRTLDALIEGGLVTLPTRSITDLPKPAPAKSGSRPLSDVLREMREQERY